MNWLLIVVLAVIIGKALIGLKAGFIKTIFALCSTFIALILTVWINPVVSDYMRGNVKLYDLVLEKVNVVLSMEDEGTEMEGEANSDEQSAFIDNLPLPASLKDTLKENNKLDVYGAMAVDNFRAYISNYFASIIINALAFIVTFIVIVIILRILSGVLDLISKLPVLNQINKSAGFLAGLLHGLVIVWLLFILLTVFGGAEFGKMLFGMIEESEILSFIYNNNLLLNFITSATKLFF